MIDGIFYAEFDNIVGPKIVFQHPPGFVSPQQFESISEYSITKQVLSHKVVSIRTGPHLICGCPIIVEHPKYHRNALIFNISFVFSQKCSCCTTELSYTEPYRGLVRKLANYFRILEEESEILFQEETKCLIPGYLKVILHQLNRHGHVNLHVAGGEGNPIRLQLPQSWKIQLSKNSCDCSTLFQPESESRIPSAGPSEDAVLWHNAITERNVPWEGDALLKFSDLEEGKVPVLIAALENQRDWDLAAQAIFPFIDGRNSVLDISIQSDVELYVVKVVLAHFVYYRTVVMINPVSLSKSFVLTSNFFSLSSQWDMFEEAAKFVATEKDSVSGMAVFKLYCFITAGQSVDSIKAAHGKLFDNVDLYRFVVFGLLNQFLAEGTGGSDALPN